MRQKAHNFSEKQVFKTTNLSLELKSIQTSFAPDDFQFRAQNKINYA